MEHLRGHRRHSQWCAGRKRCHNGLRYRLGRRKLRRAAYCSGGCTLSSAAKILRQPERRALKLVGVSFILLLAYVAFDAAKTLTSHERPERSIIGILLSVLSLIVMPLLARAKRRTAAQLNSRALHADSRQTSICAYLSAILLGGLLLNALLGWWWADPI